jgi:hypothetical protein
MEITALVAFLSPFLRPLLESGGKAAAGAVEKFGSAAWEQASKLWDRLAGRVRERPAALEAAQDVAANPDDETARTALTWQLGKLLAADPELRQELEELWQQAGSVVVTTVTASGERSVAVGGNVQGSISTGDSTGVAGPRRPPPPPGTAVER